MKSKKEYKYYFLAVRCNRACCEFIRKCDLGIDDYGIECEISLTIDRELTDDEINKMCNMFEKSKEEKSLESYFVNVKFEKCEIVYTKEDKND